MITQAYDPQDEVQDTKAVYIYSTLSVLGVGLISLVGAAISEKLMTCFGRRELWLQGFFALTVAVLSADSLLHLIPRAINGYATHIKVNFSTGNFEDGDGMVQQIIQQKPFNNQEYLIRMVLLFAIVYFLYMFELIAQSVRGLLDPTAKPHQGRSGREAFARESFRRKKRGRSLAGSVLQLESINLLKKENCSEVHQESVSNGGANDTPDTTTKQRKPNPGWLRCVAHFDPIVAIIFLGDAVHNFADGLEIGVSFTRSTWTGFSASLVVVCHEMPHEIGDYIDLREAGLTMGQALAVNAFSSIAAFIGLYVGLSIGHLQNARPWMFAITAGMFLYLAWVHILPHLKSIDISEGLCQGLVVQTIGFVLGYGVIFVLVWYEKNLQI